MPPENPIYSICIINLNMVDTVESSVRSVANQLDDRFEIVIVDGGSNDGSFNILEKLEREYPLIRLHKLKRDSNRRIGADRNKSVEIARGKYVLLNIDCDDLYEPYLLEWVQAFHLIESKRGDCLVSGRHINMVKKTFFEEIGKYKNIRFEDRDLWMRCASRGVWVCWDHVNFVTRMKRNTRQRIHKLFAENYHGLMFDYRQGLGFWLCLRSLIQNLPVKKSVNSIVKLFLSFPAFIHSRFMKPLNYDHNLDTLKFAKYRKKNRKTLSQILGEESEILKEKIKSPDFARIFLGD